MVCMGCRSIATQRVRVYRSIGTAGGNGETGGFRAFCKHATYILASMQGVFLLARLQIEGSFAQSTNTHRPICQKSVLCTNSSISGLSWAISDTPLNKWLIRQLAGRMLGILLSTDRISSLGPASSFGLAIAFCRHQLSLMVPVSLPTHVLFCRQDRTQPFLFCKEARW